MAVTVTVLKLKCDCVMKIKMSYGTCNCVVHTRVHYLYREPKVILKNIINFKNIYGTVFLQYGTGSK